MPEYSIIIPVYNRPGEVSEFLESLLQQPYRNFEVIVVDDGSSEKALEAIRPFSEQLDIKYFDKENTGPGDTRNFGMKKASGNWFLVFDSDCLLPPHYFESLQAYRARQPADAFGGPDRSHPSFTALQRAISFVLTSWLTTGGIRGKKGGLEKFNPRSFNMGMSREVFEKTGGFPNLLLAEDTDLAIRMHRMGFRVRLFEDCWVYHKRRVSFKKFFLQMKNFGYGRAILTKNHPDSFKVFFLLPPLFFTYILLSIVFSLVTLTFYVLIPLLLYLLIVFTEAWFREKGTLVALLSVPAVLIQHSGYGWGFLKGIWDIFVLGRSVYHQNSSQALKKAM